MAGRLVDPTAPRPLGRAWVAWVALGLVVIVGLALVLHARDAGHAPNYAQTWPKDYSSTPCSDWASRMNEPQRFAAAGQLLSSDRRSADGHVGEVPDSLVVSFEARITTACELPVKSGTIDLAGLGSFLYGAHRDQYRP